MAKLGIDLTQVQEQKAQSGYSFVPAGKYEAKVVKAEVKQTKAGGSMIVFDLEIQDFGDHVDKVIPYNVNIINANPDAVKIGLSSLKTLANACGLNNPNKINDTDEFLTGVAFDIEITERKDGEKSFSNVKSVFKKLATSAAPATSKKMPWDK
jgi:hypothetical protein